MPLGADHSNSLSTGAAAANASDGNHGVFVSADASAAAAAAAGTSHTSQLVNQQNASNNAKHAKRFSLLHAFVPSFVFVVATLVLSTVVVLESESALWAPVRGMPEMVSLRYQYYQPLKEFIMKQFLSTATGNGDGNTNGNKDDN